jgi:hypothetical protein
VSVPQPPQAHTSSEKQAADATLASAQQSPDDAPQRAETPAAVANPSDAGESAKAITEPRRVLILGDSLAATGFGALLERKLDAHSAITCYRKGKSASGLARPDFFDWLAEAPKHIEFRKPDLVVVIMGGNDGQDLTTTRGRGGRVAWKSGEWSAEYRARMTRFMEVLADSNRRVLWLGLPTMGLSSLERKLETIREIQREVVESLGGIYLDTQPYVTSEDGELVTEARVGPRKRLERIRADDRIHFTMSGSEYFAAQVYPEVLSALGMADEVTPPR